MAGSAESVRKAIVTAWGANVTLAAVPFFFGRVPRGTSMPFARFMDVSNVPTYFYGSASANCDDWVFQFDLWHTDRTALASLAETLTAAFHWQSLTLDSGRLVVATRQSTAVSLEPSTDKNSNEVYRAMVTFSFYVQN